MHSLRRRLTAALVAVPVGLAGCGGSQLIVVRGGGNVTGVGVHDTADFTAELKNHGTTAATLERATLLGSGKNPALTLVGARVQHFRGEIVDYGWPPHGYSLNTGPLKGFEVQPGQTVGIAFGVRSRRAGSFRVQGLRLTYLAGSRTHRVNVVSINRVCFGRSVSRAKSCGS